MPHAKCGIFSEIMSTRLSVAGVSPVRTVSRGCDPVGVFVVVDGYDSVVGEVAFDEDFGEGVFEIFLDRAFEGTCAILDVIAFSGDVVFGIFGQPEGVAGDSMRR